MSRSVGNIRKVSMDALGDNNKSLINRKKIDSRQSDRRPLGPASHALEALAKLSLLSSLLELHSAKV